MRRAHPVTHRPLDVAPPAPSSTIILACFGDAALERLLVDVCETLGRVVVVRERIDLLAVTNRCRADLVLLPLVDFDERPVAPLITRVLIEHRPVAVCVPAGTAPRGLVAAIQSGAHVLQWTTSSDLRDALSRLVGLPTMTADETTALADCVASVSPLPMKVLLLSCATAAHHQLSVDALAQLANVSSRTLNRATARAGWPPPSEVIVWGRLLRAGIARWQGSTSHEALARISGFASGHALAAAAVTRLKVCEDLDGLSPLRVMRALHRRVSPAMTSAPRS
jgi:hypothetical protein